MSAFTYGFLHVCMQFNTIQRILASEHPELAGPGNFIAPANRYYYHNYSKTKKMVYYEKSFFFSLHNYADLIARLLDC